MRCASMRGEGGDAVSEVQQLATFVVRATYDDLSEHARRELKTRVLDSLGCAIGALEGEPIAMLREHLAELGGNPLATTIGGGKTAPDRAALYNGALVRYLDFNDTYLAPRESCHPSDNLAPVLAGAEYADASGRDLMAALAVAYQVQCRLCDEAPVRAKGFDHTTQGSYSVAAGVARALGLDAGRAANAIAIAGTALNALRVTRTGAISHWKGLAFPHTAFGGAHAAFMAMQRITGPEEVFEGNKGFKDAIAGPFEIDWSREGLERVTRTIIKKYNAEAHSQSGLEALLELRRTHALEAGQVERMEVDTFDVGYHIIGGGEEGDKTIVRTKEEADHSFHYMMAVALLDGQVMPEQYRPERIRADDVQDLLRRVSVREDAEFSRRFPNEMPVRVRLHLTDGRTLTAERGDYEGFHTNPMRWETVVDKFNRLGEPYADASLRREIVQAVEGLEAVRVRDLAALLSRVRLPGA